MRNFPRIQSSYDKSMLSLSCYPRVLDFEQLKSKKNPIRGRLKETSRTASLRLGNELMMAEPVQSTALR